MVIRDGLGGLALILMRGPILLCLALVGLIVAVLGGYGWGRRATLKEIDEKRAVVAKAIERRLTETCPMLPTDRVEGAYPVVPRPRDGEL